ncbi:hypothetical protein D3C80_1024020 [compost metagenome]
MISENTPRLVRPVAEKITASPGTRVGSGNLSSSDRPTIRATMSSTVSEEKSSVEIYRPSRSTVTRSTISAISSSRCEI